MNGKNAENERIRKQKIEEEEKEVGRATRKWISLT